MTPQDKIDALTKQVEEETERADTAESELCNISVVCDGTDPSDGEGTHPHEVTEKVEFTLKQLQLQCEVMREALKLRTGQIDALLAHCGKESGECSGCAAIICPFEEPLHFHHDGCPACCNAPKNNPILLKRISLDEALSLETTTSILSELKGKTKMLEEIKDAALTQSGVCICNMAKEALNPNQT